MNSNNKNSIPWVEKYRPVHFDDIVLSSINRKIFNNIITKNYFTNLPKTKGHVEMTQISIVNKIKQ